MSGSSDQTLARLCSLSGVTCMVISAYHYLLGTRRTVPGGAEASASIDSHESFIITIFGWYGVQWWRAGRKRPVPAREAQALAATMAVGGVGRLISLIRV